MMCFQVTNISATFPFYYFIAAGGRRRIEESPRKAKTTKKLHVEQPRMVLAYAPHCQRSATWKYATRLCLVIIRSATRKMVLGMSQLCAKHLPNGHTTGISKNCSKSPAQSYHRCALKAGKCKQQATKIEDSIKYYTLTLVFMEIDNEHLRLINSNGTDRNDCINSDFTLFSYFDL